MKKYEAPIVELTKFDVEDVITTSIKVSDIVADTTGAAATAAVADIKANAASNGLEGVFTW